MQNESLADRLSNYADGLVAATFVFMGGLGAAIGEPETRCEIGDAAPKIGFVILVGGGFVLYALRWLRLSAERLRPKEKVSEEAARVMSRLESVRLALTLAFILFACVFVLLSLTDGRCEAILSAAR